ncbi:VanZ family protein [Lachnospiraceae bacterium OF09-33XD]|nr:VanZ family protein [Lachnospiraceae bacterium OF09-33XD]
MDLYQIFITHNRKWSSVEIFCFIIVFLTTAFIVGYLHHRKHFVYSQAVAVLLTVAFLAVVFESTVFGRNPLPERQYELHLFWSWNEVFFKGSNKMLEENLLNCLLLVPFGALLPAIFHKRIGWKRSFLYGFLISLTIELCQLVLRRGLFEWDDMIHNAFGCMLGCKTMEFIYRKLKAAN